MNDYVPMQGFGPGRLDRTVDLGTVRRRRRPTGPILIVIALALAVVGYLQWPTIGPWLEGVAATALERNDEPVTEAPASAETPDSGSGAVPPGSREATVEYVHDGDTLFLAMDNGERLKVRLLGIDTPEVGDNEECFGASARAELRALLPEGTPVFAFAVERERDRFGRSLFYLFTEDGSNVNLELVSTGAATVLLLGDSDEYWDDLERAESDARSAGLGLWGEC